VRDVSQDFVQSGQQIAFKAVIDLDSMQLRSASGVAVDLRRGMTINARFILKKRTLFNLLYSKMSESLDPGAKPVAD
jgi:HlyD family secretion protein